MEAEIVCNFKKCRKELTTQAWVTSCSHAFCIEHSSQDFADNRACPACHTLLPGKYDAILVNLNPPEDYKSVVLAGHKPDVVLDICTRAMNFWTYQVHAELTYWKYVYDKANSRQLQLEKYYENVLQKAKSELEKVMNQLNVTKKQLEASQKQVAELAEKLNERRRQYQKLQLLHDSLRRKFLSPLHFDKGNTETRKDGQNHLPHSRDAALHNSMERSRHHSGYDSEREFVLKIRNTPVLGMPKNPFSIMNPENRF